VQSPLVTFERDDLFSSNEKSVLMEAVIILSFQLRITIGQNDKISAPRR
jgi:hypothetical protein